MTQKHDKMLLDVKILKKKKDVATVVEINGLRYVLDTKNKKQS